MRTLNVLFAAFGNMIGSATVLESKRLKVDGLPEYIFNDFSV